jgi:hypothetical protein
MTPTEFRLEIPLEIPSQNTTGKGRTWHARAAATRKVRKKWFQMTWIKMHSEGIPSASGPRSLHIIAYRKRRCADTANLIGGAKAAIDGMVDAKLLVDDRDSCARITYEQQVASKSPSKKPHTTLILTDL